MKILHIIAFVLLVVGGLNWGVMALAPSFELGTLLGGMDTMLAKVVYVLVALSAVFLAVTHKSACNTCVAGAGGMGSQQGGSSMSGM